MDKKFLTTDELQLLRDFQTNKNQIMNDFGLLEIKIQDLKIQKQKLINDFTKLKQQEETTGLELQTKYGDGNIDLNTGEFTSI